MSSIKNVVQYREYDQELTYTGELEGNFRQGMGKLCYKNQDYLDGVWEQGKFIEGIARKTFANGVIYEGQWNPAGGYPEGEGSLVYPEGWFFKGLFQRWKCLSGHAKLPRDDESFYEGNILNHKIQGLGTIRFKNGDYRSGYWMEEKISYRQRGRLTSADGSIYEGEMASDVPHGHGIWICSPSETLKKSYIYSEEGIWDNGSFTSGSIVFKHADGSIYSGSGQVIKGMLHPHGIGRIGWISGRWEEGYFDKGCRVGLFRGQFSHGLSYEVWYSEDNVSDSYEVRGLHGVTLCSFPGQFIFPNNETFFMPSLLNADSSFIFQYDGNILGEQFDGEGVLQHFKEGWLFAGKFCKGLFAEGLLKHRSGWSYRGTFLRNQFHGKGVFHFSSGKKYEGSFFSGRFHGIGKIVEGDRIIWEGYFEQGEKT